MIDQEQFVATPWGQSSRICECCGNTTKTIWGDLSMNSRMKAAYYVQWTDKSPDHYPNVDFVVGQWGDGVCSDLRKLVALRYRPDSDGGQFMVIDAAGRPADDRSICGRALTRDEVIGTPLAEEIFSMIDAVWLGDPRIEEVMALCE
ncbi:hypothetical protein [Planctomicrobium piriforme]|uniref:Uncharacterized protein n=1 Tax=Planctomicrobium piriforme TaxID=1576369 RepID=A0A1I3MQW8_9PLAN|nr:hypothetical protein [Planctomicrobium piriforme]SFI99418.1 hypothetical protein SAMN05421753_11482 [Planctomicrobium piriforme]